MAYTESDLLQVEAAVIALAKGDRVAMVRFSDGTEIQYNQIRDGAKLLAIRQMIKSELQSASGRRRFVLTTTSKGL